MDGKPRVMTLEEVKSSDFVHFEFHDVIWEDCAVFFEPLGRDIVLVSPENGRWYMPEVGYNDSWRCWTTMPTPEQREAEPWAL